MNSLGTDLDISALAHMMPDSWAIFFRQRSPWPGQALVMPHILKGESVLFAAPTASGKTEAVIAPLFQRHMSFQRDRLSTVYIAPTKALVNDLYFRMEDYFGVRLPGAVQRYTGDHHDFRTSNDAFCLIATPEALDSLQLMRPHDLTDVRAIVIDEIHLLHGSARGQQLRYVIERIRQATTNPKSTRDNFQIVGMTATIDQIDEVRNLWLGSNSIAVSHGTPRAIDLEFIDVPTDKQASKRAIALRLWMETNEAHNVLIFDNSRNGAHALAAALASALAGTRWSVHLHIGILTATERERVETAMRSERFWVCVATSTLEIGIDIGAIDAIVFANPPVSVSAFLQRIGRGNRKNDTCRVVAFRDSLESEALFLALLSCARQGDLDDVHEFDRPSVRFQQVLSLTWRAVRVGHALTREGIKTQIGGDDYDAIIDDMLETESLRNIREALIPSDELMDLGDKRLIHTLISGGNNLAVIDMSSGETLVTSGRGASGGTMYVGGKLKRLQHGADGYPYLVKPKVGQEQLATLPTTRRSGGFSRSVIWALARQKGYDPTIWHWEDRRLVTWGGILYNRLLIALLAQDGFTDGCIANDILVDGIPGHSIIDLSKIFKLAVEAQDRRTLPRSEAKRFLEKTRYLSALSPAMQAEEERNSIPFPGFIRWINGCKGIRPTPGVVQE